jgi:hypothetical protein
VCSATIGKLSGSSLNRLNWFPFKSALTTGHGGNVELRRRGSKGYRVTVLEVVNSDTGIERVEEAWKKKLMSRKFGLNKN